MKNRSYAVLYGVFAVLYVLVALNYPMAIWPQAMHDDGYFAACARRFATGNWLGSYNQMRLIKGPGYPFFLALTHLLGLPLALTTALLFLGACLTTAWALRRAGLPAGWAFALYLLLLFQPAFFPYRIIRDYCCHALSLYAIAGIVYLVTANGMSLRKTGLLGLACGFFLITREDPQWLFCAMAFLLCGKALLTLRSGREKWAPLLVGLVCYACCAVLPALVVSTINQIRYGVFAVTDITLPAFKRALSSLYGVSEYGEDKRHIPVSRATLEAIFAVSPSAKQLEQYFTQDGLGWTLHMRRRDGEYHAAHFMWALRDGVAALGKYQTPQDAARFYENLAQEIGHACATEQLRCQRTLLPFMPRIPAVAWKHSLKELAPFGKSLLYFYPPDSPPSDGPPDEVAALGDFLAISRSSGFYVPMHLAGWYYTKDAGWFTVRCQDRQFTPDRAASPGVAKFVDDPKAGAACRFAFRVNDPDHCSIIFDDPKAKAVSVRALKNFRWDAPETGRPVRMLWLDSKGLRMNPGWGLGVVKTLRPVFRWINAALLLLGTAALCANLLHCRRTRTFPPLMLVATGLWIGFYARFGLLALVSISSFGAAQTTYMLPMWSFLTMAALLSLFIHLSRRRRNRAALTDGNSTPDAPHEAH